MNVKIDAPGKLYWGKQTRKMGVTQTFNVNNISTSKTHDVLAMGKNAIIMEQSIKRQGDKKYFTKFDTDGRRAGVSDCVDMSSSTLIMSIF